MDKLIRLGKVSKIDYEHGMISVTFPDLDDAVTVLLSTVSFNDEYKMPKIGDEVMSIHLPTGQARGLVFGHYWNKTNKPKKYGEHLYRKEYGHEYGEAYVEYEDGEEWFLFAPAIRFQTANGAITVDQIISRLDNIERRLSVLEGGG